jgi:hypothetical protein
MVIESDGRCARRRRRSSGSSAIRPTRSPAAGSRRWPPPIRSPKLRHFLTQVVVTPGSHALIELVLRHRDGELVEVEPVAVNLLSDPAVERHRPHPARHSRAPAAREAARPHGVPRLADRARQPRSISPSSWRTRAAAARRHGSACTPSLRRSRRLQACQRRARTRAGDQVLVELGRRLAARPAAPTPRRASAATSSRCCSRPRRSRRGARRGRAAARHARRRPVRRALARARRRRQHRRRRDAPHDTDEDLLRHADFAMYHAKERGKGRVVVFDPALDRESPRRKRENELRRALERGELELHFQPVCAHRLRSRRSAPRRCCAGGAAPGLFVSARRVPRPRRGDRPDRADRRLGGRRGVPFRRRGRASRRAPERRLQRLGAADRRRRLRGDGDGRAHPSRLRAGEPGRRDHRVDGGEQPRRVPRQPRRAARASACASPSTTSAPATRRCSACRSCRSRSSRSTAAWSPRSAGACRRR